MASAESIRAISRDGMQQERVEIAARIVVAGQDRSGLVDVGRVHIPGGARGKRLGPVGCAGYVQVNGRSATHRPQDGRVAIGSEGTRLDRGTGRHALAIDGHYTQVAAAGKAKFGQGAPTEFKQERSIPRAIARYPDLAGHRIDLADAHRPAVNGSVGSIHQVGNIGNKASGIRDEALLDLATVRIPASDHVRVIDVHHCLSGRIGRLQDGRYNTVVLVSDRLVNPGDR